MAKGIKIIFIRYFFLVAMLAMVLCRCNPKIRMANIIANHPEVLKTDSSSIADSAKVEGAVSDGSVSEDSLKGSSKEHPIVIDSNGVKTTLYEEQTPETVTDSNGNKKIIYKERIHAHTNCPPTYKVWYHTIVKKYYQTVHNVHTKWYWYLIFYGAGIISGLLLTSRKLI
jgi:hypothetical protein